MKITSLLGTLLVGLTLGVLGCPEEDPGDDPILTPPPRFEVVAGSTTRICQLTGEWDEAEAAHADLWIDEAPTPNQTGSRFELFGTDLGSSFEHDGKLWFLFGDTFTTLTIPGDPEHIESGSGEGKPLAADATAWSADDDPTDCVDLTFLTETGTEPDTFLNPTFDVDGGTVQQDGVSVGGSMYVWFSSLGSEQGSALARSDDHGRTFEVLYDVSTGPFIGIQAVLLDDVAIPGLEDLGTEWVLLFGTGDYRESDLYLAAQPRSDLDQGDEIHVFAGLDDDGTPTWSRDEGEARAIVDTDNPMRTGDNPFGYVDPDKADAEGCVSEFSVHYSPTSTPGSRCTTATSGPSRCTPPPSPGAPGPHPPPSSTRSTTAATAASSTSARTWRPATASTATSTSPPPTAPIPAPPTAPTSWSVTPSPPRTAWSCTSSCPRGTRTTST